MSNLTAQTLAAIETLYARATGSWTGADWTHFVCVDGSDTETECDGSDGCETCRVAAQAARDAEDAAAEAMGYLREGDIDGAQDAARRARREEMWCGDDPTWGSWARAVEAIEALEETEDDEDDDDE